MEENNTYDVIIVGGSYAGLSAAMALGRSLRKVLVIDSGQPCNQQTPHSHNFITQDGKTPAEISQEAKRQVLAYPSVEFRNDLVTTVSGQNNSFTVKTQGNLILTCKKLILATGVRDLMPAIEGFAPCWGISVIHCPYCHGYEVRGKNTGILVNGEAALTFGKLISNWTKELTIFTNGEAEFDPSELVQIGIRIVEKPVGSFLHENGYLKQIRFKDGSLQSIDAIYARPPFEQHFDGASQLDCEMTEEGFISVADFQKTSVDGVFAVGDCATYFRAVSIATASGTMAGAAANHELILEGF